ncbi:MAG: chromosome segregation protein SMC, partial [Thermoproteota archaeon]
MNKDGNLQHITQTQIIKRIVSIIDANEGDVGRLSYILESLKQDKPLYHSDHMYLENKFNMLFMIIDDEKPKENEAISKIQKLIDSDDGDPGRLQHICDMLSQNKPLYQSDQVYLENKFGTNNVPLKNNITHFDVKTEDKINRINKLEKEITLPEVKHNPTPLKLRGLMPRDWHPPENNLNELIGIYEKIKTEEEILGDRQKIYDEINLQRSKLSQLILNRKDYEKQVSLEKILLESQIKEEHINIQTQTKISEQIISQKEELEKVKFERNELMKKIAIEKDTIAKDLQYQKNQLTQTQLEQEEIEKQIKHEQILLAKMFEEQKSNLLKQAQIAHEIKEKQT